MTKTQLFITIAAMIAATMITRALPFILMKNNKPTPKIIEYFGKTLPYASVALLVIYCMKDISFLSLSGFLPIIISVAVTALLHWWKGKTLLSIGVGTLLYMLLIQFVFV